MVSIITDSLACLTREMVSQYGILIVPISIYFRDKVYRDWVDISPTEAYKLFLQDPESFATSPSSPGQYLEAYREASNRTKDMLCVTLSSKLSTGYEVARVEREQAMTELPGVSIEVMDSLTVTAAEGLIALAAAREAAEGKDLAQVIKTAESV
ncbi:MAG: DegV family protein, partial [Dehalococcoidales bacterium]|nr:DegV family protein [Dehalococcoidales bacterium]